jgi:hypothetical protein
MLPTGAVSATLVDSNPENPTVLRAGDFLILEIVIPEKTLSANSGRGPIEGGAGHSIKLPAHAEHSSRRPARHNAGRNLV